MKMVLNYIHIWSVDLFLVEDKVLSEEFDQITAEKSWYSSKSVLICVLYLSGTIDL